MRPIFDASHGTFSEFHYVTRQRSSLVRENILYLKMEPYKYFRHYFSKKILNATEIEHIIQLHYISWSCLKLCLNFTT